MPNLDGLTAALPLAEIIPQLPAAVFTEGLREPVPEVELVGEPIPDPFQEKGAVTETPAPEPGQINNLWTGVYPALFGPNVKLGVVIISILHVGSPKCMGDDRMCVSVNTLLSSYS